MLPFLNTLIKRTWMVVLLISVMLLNACKDSDKNSSLIFEELNESLERSNETLEQNIAVSIRYLEQLTKMPETAEKSFTLLNKAKIIQSSSLSVIVFIDSLNTQIKNSLSVDSQIKYTNNFVTELFIKQNRGNELYRKLINCKDKILSVDERIKKEFENKLPTTNKKFNEIYFKNTTISQAIALLSKFKNDVLITENQTILFLRNSICVLGIVYDKK